MGMTGIRAFLMMANSSLRDRGGGLELKDVRIDAQESVSRMRGRGTHFDRARVIAVYHRLLLLRR